MINDKPCIILQDALTSLHCRQLKNLDSASDAIQPETFDMSYLHKATKDAKKNCETCIPTLAMSKIPLRLDKRKIMTPNPVKMTATPSAGLHIQPRFMWYSLPARISYGCQSP